MQDDAQLLHRSEAETRASLLRLQQLGVSTVRVTAGWSVLTQAPDAELAPPFEQSDPTAYDQGRFAGLDRLVRLAPAYGLSTMIDVAFWAPHWATTDLPGPRARTHVDPEAYGRFAAAIARRYDGTFTPPARTSVAAAGRSSDDAFLDALFGLPATGPSERTQRGVLPVLGGAAPGGPASGPLPKVSTFTLWNEPNHPAFLQPQWVGRGAARRPASPGVYRRMVRAAYPALKAAQPEATVLVGGTAAQSSGAKGVAPLAFLRRLACVDTRLRPVRDHDCADFAPVPGDGFSHHPYSLRTTPEAHADDPDHVPIGDLDRLTGLLRRLVAAGRIAPAMRELWLTEYGYETNPPDPEGRYSTGDQARFLTWAEYLAARNPDVRSFAQFLLRDLPPATTVQSASVRRSFGQWESGLAFADGRPKLASDSFEAGIHVRTRAGRGTVLVWGRIRTLTSGTRRSELQASSRGGRWRTVRSHERGSRRAPRGFRSGGVFSRELRAVPAGRYRLRWRDATGALHTTPSVAAVGG